MAEMMWVGALMLADGLAVGAVLKAFPKQVARVADLLGFGDKPEWQK